MTGRESAYAITVMAASAVLAVVAAAAFVGSGMRLATPSADSRVAATVSNFRPSPEAIRICAANVQNTPDMADSKVRADVRTARRSCDLILWQEIGEKADHRAVHEALGRGWRTSRLETRPSPISWRTSKFALAGKAREIRVSDPTPRCRDGSPSYNPARRITLAPLRVRATGQRFTVVSLHFPQRKGCRQHDRADRWRQAYATTKARLPAGPLVIGGDWNRREHEIPPMRPWHWTTRAPNSLDHTAFAGTGWTVERKFTRDLNSDHHLTGCVAVV